MPSQRVTLGIGFAILLIISAASIGLDVRSRSETGSVDRTLTVLKRISDLRPLLRGAESAARGFALTGDAGFVDEYRNTSAALLSGKFRRDAIGRRDQGARGRRHRGGR